MGNGGHQGERVPTEETTERRVQAQMSMTGSYSNIVYEQYVQKEMVCCFKFNKTIKRRVTWESKFISNCEQLRTDYGYLWAGELIEMVSHNELSENKYVREVQHLRHEKREILIRQESEMVSDPQELERFKKNLKKSVIVSFVQNPKTPHDLPLATNSIFLARHQEPTKRINYLSGFNQERPKTHNGKSEMRSSGSSFEDHSHSSTFEVGKEVPKQTANDLQVFLKFSSILQRHLSDSNCMLGMLRRKFVNSFQQTFRVSAGGKDMEQAVEVVQAFLALLTAGVMDYYNLRAFGQGQIGSNMFISNEQNILSTCTAIVFRDHQFYNCLFALIAGHFRKREQRFAAILAKLKGSGPEFFSVKDKFCLNSRTIRSYLNHLSVESGSNNVFQNIEIEDVVVEHSEPYKTCMLSLCEMAKSRSPINKLKSIMACSESITNEIQKFYDLNGLRKEKWMLDADQVLSIFCYLIVGARMQHLHTHLYLLDNFASSLQMISMTGYYLSVLRCAVEQLQNEHGDKLE